jgi:hypothetical protein
MHLCRGFASPFQVPPALNGSKGVADGNQQQERTRGLFRLGGRGLTARSFGLHNPPNRVKGRQRIMETTQPDLVTCSCNNCDGHLEFERQHAGQRINCPHCGLETVLYSAEAAASGVQTVQNSSESKSANQLKAKSNSFGLEKLIFGITRMFVLGLATLTVIGLVLLGLGFLIVLREHRQQRQVSYEEVSVSFMPSPASSSARGVEKVQAVTSVPIPANVLEQFTATRQVLNGWLDQMDKAEQKQFLENLSVIISKAKAAGVGRSKMDGVIERFKEIWESKATLEKSKQIERQISKAAFASSAFALLLILTMLSMVLVLLAIERNTRVRAPAPSDRLND